MDLQLFQDLTPAERIEMLDAQADEVTEEMYLRPYDNSELVGSVKSMSNFPLKWQTSKPKRMRFEPSSRKGKTPSRRDEHALVKHSPRW